jgi:CRISPR-associated endonuclease Csn1
MLAHVGRLRVFRPLLQQRLSPRITTTEQIMQGGIATNKTPLDPVQPVALTFGLDIGIASVGWAVLAAHRIVNLGVRCFDAAETPDKGEPLNLRRRLMRTARNRLNRRALRLKKLRRLLRDAGVLSSADVSAVESTPRDRGAKAAIDPWTLRAEGLDRLLPAHEWARVLYHLVKRRGFFAARKSETVDDKKEGGKLSKGVARTRQLLEHDGAPKWRTIGEMAARDDAFRSHKRNKSGSYDNSFARALIESELRFLFERQRGLGNAHAHASLQDAVLSLFTFQKEAITGNELMARVGRCTFEPTEYRAPKRSFSAERFIWLGKLNHLRIVESGQRRALNDAERQAAIDLPYQYETGRVTYKQLRKAIGLTDAAEAGFAGLPYGSKKNKKGEIVDPEEATLVELKGWADMRKALLGAAQEGAWQRISGAALSGSPHLMDAIALALSVYKSDAELTPKLAALGFTPEEVEALLSIDYTSFIQLSTLCLHRLLPHLEAGLRYDEACEAAGYNHAQPKAERGKLKKLPALSPNDVRNPVVFRSLNQARKVINALIRQYGSPCAVHVELARDLSKPFDERKDIERAQKEYQDEKRHVFEYFVEQVGRAPKRDDLLKMRLYRDQGGQCAYSFQPLAPGGDVSRVFEIGVTEVDHVLPYSRSFDDSQNNKVLVLAKENRDKGNRTPFEYLDGINESQRWREFEAWVRGQKTIRKAKRDRLLRKHFDDEEAESFKARNLNDTRYATRLFANHVKQWLQFAADNTGAVRTEPVLTPAGGFTGFIRARWGLHKDRSASDLHHALDACVIAAASRSLQKRVSDFSRRNELVQLADGKFADTKTGEILDGEAAALLGTRFPEPWPGFRDEVQARLAPDPRAALGGRFASYDEAALLTVHPVLISRAVRARKGGKVHDDSINSVKGAPTGKVYKRVFLQELTLKKLDQIAEARDTQLLAALKQRLEQFGGDGKRAFGESQPPFRKPSADGKNAPVVRKVKLLATQSNGVRVRGGLAELGVMSHVAVFRTAKGYFIQPRYQVPSESMLSSLVPPDGASFQFTLCKNELIEVVMSGDVTRGYFVMYESDGRVTLRSHDQPQPDKQFFRRTVSTATSISKLHVDVLGNCFPVRNEAHHGLA